MENICQELYQHRLPHEKTSGDLPRVSLTFRAKPREKAEHPVDTPQPHTKVAKSVLGRSEMELPSDDPHILVDNLSHGGKLSVSGFSDCVVDRSSPLGNPFRMGEDGHDENLRMRACEAYQEYIHIIMRDAGGPTLEEIAKREGLKIDPRFKGDDGHVVRHGVQALVDRVRARESLRLLCWCHPRRCHAHSIAGMVSKLATVCKSDTVELESYAASLESGATAFGAVQEGGLGLPAAAQ